MPRLALLAEAGAGAGAGTGVGAGAGAGAAAGAGAGGVGAACGLGAGTGACELPPPQAARLATAMLEAARPSNCLRLRMFLSCPSMRTSLTLESSWCVLARKAHAMLLPPQAGRPAASVPCQGVPRRVHPAAEASFRGYTPTHGDRLRSQAAVNRHHGVETLPTRRWRDCAVLGDPGVFCKASPALDLNPGLPLGTCAFSKAYPIALQRARVRRALLSCPA